jgi:guanine nucleotide-binding protein G(t) subunit alpha
MAEAETADRLENKLLLLGTGSSGKSTLFKGLKILKGEKFDSRDYHDARQIIRGNLVTAARKLWEQCIALGFSEPELFSPHARTISESDEDYLTLVRLNDASATADDLEIEEGMLPAVGEMLQRVWARGAIKFTHENRGGRFAIYENMDYFFDRAMAVMDPGYLPSEEDMLKSRQRTTGITTWEYSHDKWLFKIFDVGGQRNERRKWIELFSGVHAVLFMAALNHYNYVLFEKDNTNAMHESLRLFQEIAEQKYFRMAEIVLLLNKDDLFRQSLGEGHSLSLCFSEDQAWEGTSYSGPEWPGPDYEPKADGAFEDDPDFQPCYQAALDFILQQYLALNPIESRVVYNYVLIGTDIKRLRETFDEVQDVVIKANLRRHGLVM